MIEGNRNTNKSFNKLDLKNSINLNFLQFFNQSLSWNRMTLEMLRAVWIYFVNFKVSIYIIGRLSFYANCGNC